MKWRVFLQIVWDSCLSTKLLCLFLDHFKLANLCLLVCKSLASVRPLCDVFWIVIFGVVFCKILTDYWIFIPTLFIMMLYDCPWSWGSTCCLSSSTATTTSLFYCPSSDSFFVLVHLDDPLETVGIATNDIENRVPKLCVIRCFSLDMN